VGTTLELLKHLPATADGRPPLDYGRRGVSGEVFERVAEHAPAPERPSRQGAATNALSPY
jgi:hypothetical protein